MAEVVLQVGIASRYCRYELQVVAKAMNGRASSGSDSGVPCVDHQIGGLRGELTRGDARVRAPPVVYGKWASAHLSMHTAVRGGGM